MFWFKKSDDTKELERELRQAEQDRDYAVGKMEFYASHYREAMDNEWSFSRDAWAGTARLRGRTHAISERLSKENGRITRENDRLWLAARRACALLGANMHKHEGKLVGVYGDDEEGFVRDIRYIHGLCPELKKSTGTGYDIRDYDQWSIVPLDERIARVKEDTGVAA